MLNCLLNLSTSCRFTVEFPSTLVCLAFQLATYNYVGLAKLSLDLDLAEALVLARVDERFEFLFFLDDLEFGGELMVSGFLQIDVSETGRKQTVGLPPRARAMAADTVDLPAPLGPMIILRYGPGKISLSS